MTRICRKGTVFVSLRKFMDAKWGNRQKTLILLHILQRQKISQTTPKLRIKSVHSL